MPNSGTSAPPAKTIRLIHASLIVGVVLFGLVTHFVPAPEPTSATMLPDALVKALPVVTVAACALVFFLRRMVPRRAPDDSADLFWSRATVPAMTMWAPLEGVCLLDVLVYWRNGSQTALVLAILAVALFVFLSPASLERR